MSRGYNRVVLMGNLARDPEVRHTPSKQKVARITVATGRQWKNKVTGEMQSQVDFIPVSVWGSLADICERYLSKGRPVLLEGRLSVRSFDDQKTGQRKWITEVVADNIVLLGSGGKRDDSPYGMSSVPAPQGGPQHQPDKNFSAADVGSLRDDMNFEDEFPLDFSELPDSDDGPGDVDIPF